MIALIQRVIEASVEIDNATVARIGQGLLAFIAVQQADGSQEISRMAEKLCRYRIFADENGRMNRSAVDIGAEILLVPQFTLAADTSKGLRPSFHLAADPDSGRQGFADLLVAIRALGLEPRQGEFGANMQVHLINDGPVTFWLETP